MKIRKSEHNNEYTMTSHGIWVRNLTKGAYPVDVNNLIPEKEYGLLIANEFSNAKLNLMDIENEAARYSKCAIISSGLNWLDYINVPKDVLVIGTNSVLKNWDYKTRIMDYYLVNNPYPECLSFMPKNKYFPKCIMSCRTSSDFVNRYKGVKYQYYPTCNSKFSGIKKSGCMYLDDYRNSICACIAVANFFSVDKILLVACDEIHKEEKAGMVAVEKGFMYEQHRAAHEIIDLQGYWLGKSGVQIGHLSAWTEYKHIGEVGSVDKFFSD